MKKLISLLMVCFMIFALVACSGGDGQSENSTSNSKSNATKITFWAPFSGPDGPKMKEIVEEYNKSQEEYMVDLQIVPQSEYYKTVDLAISGKENMPELLIMHGDQIVNYAAKDALKSLNDVLGETVTKEQYHENAWEGATFDGNLYGVPLDIHPLMFYWNKDLFEKAGLDPDTPPQTREEFVDYAEKLTDKDMQQYGFVVPTLWPQQFIFPTIVNQNGGQLIADGKVNFTSEPVVEALQFQRELIEKYQVSPADVQQDGEVTMFLQGKNAMHLNGPWMLQQWEDAGINFGVAPVPQLGTEQQAVFANS
ncbi:MAG TPA: ABC transporter substrate-binding protein, partial [Metabacillus sp.]|nr:ABC transporter substrate-binding protein [Metabacillus sp.]